MAFNLVQTRSRDTTVYMVEQILRKFRADSKLARCDRRGTCSQ
ncbi:hypothetical protein [Oxynema sp. CENA135]|nr:hypothetical protein [Oxynema sp. CENA135]